MILFLMTHKLKAVCLSSMCVFVQRLSAIMDHVWKLCVPDMNMKPCDLKAVGAPEKSMNLQLGQSVRQSSPRDEDREENSVELSQHHPDPGDAAAASSSSSGYQDES